MSIESNRQLAIEFFRCHDQGDIDGALALMAEDCTYWLAGKPGTNPTCGTRSKHEIGGVFRRMARNMTGPLRMSVRGTVAEGDKVAVEATSRGELRNGRVHGQEYTC